MTTATRNIAIAAVLLMLLTALPAAAKDLPKAIAGITLGEQYTQYKALSDPDTATPMADALYLSEVKIQDGAIPGIRGGSITFGNCQKPGRVLRVKLKFANRSEDLFNKLLKLYKKRFGKPGKWEGDPFKVVQAWQWEIREGGETLTFTLAHSKDLEMRPGVSIKMTMRSWMDDERLCWSDAHPEAKTKEQEATNGLDLNEFVPH